MGHAFKVNLRGIIDLLSEHLYSSPEVFVRELLQNAVDAIQARRQQSPDHEGAITLELIAGDDKAPASLVVTDNGIGLSEEDAHRFLATIGESSKRLIEERRHDFIGQFGIGLLSAFVVSDEIVVVTRRADANAPAIEWRGSSDGTYAIRTLKADIAAGTRVHLRARPDRAEYFEFDRLLDLARRYGALLPHPITLKCGKRSQAINEDSPDWLFTAGRHTGKRRQEMLRYGKRVLGDEFLDVIPLASPEAGVFGAAFVLSRDPGPHAQRHHRVYLKRMLLTEAGEGLLPDWAFFVRCVVNATGLRPTASREGFYEDAALERTREALGRCIRDHLMTLAEEEPERMAKLIDAHHQALKRMAVHDDELLTIIADLLPFETTMGLMTLGEYRKQNPVIRFVPTRDQFRQIAPIAAAQNHCLINAGYAFDQDLLLRVADVMENAEIEQVDVTAIADDLGDLTVAEREATAGFLDAAEAALAPFRCQVELRRFRPVELPVLYTTALETQFLRSAERAQEISDDHWAGLIGKVTPKGSRGPRAQVCLNLENPLVRRMAAMKLGPSVASAVRLLYVQALLLGHHPLTSAELDVLSRGLMEMLERNTPEPGATP